jgi:hypothetical protein
MTCTCVYVILSSNFLPEPAMSKLQLAPFKKPHKQKASFFELLVQTNLVHKFSCSFCIKQFSQNLDFIPSDLAQLVACYLWFRKDVELDEFIGSECIRSQCWNYLLIQGDQSDALNLVRNRNKRRIFLKGSAIFEQQKKEIEEKENSICMPLFLDFTTELFCLQCRHWEQEKLQKLQSVFIGIQASSTSFEFKNTSQVVGLRFSFFLHFERPPPIVFSAPVQLRLFSNFTQFFETIFYVDRTRVSEIPFILKLKFRVPDSCLYPVTFSYALKNIDPRNEVFVYSSLPRVEYHELDLCV